MRIQILELPPRGAGLLNNSSTPFIIILSEVGDEAPKLQEYLASRDAVGAQDIWAFEGPVTLGPSEPTYPPNVITWGEPELPTEVRKTAAETDLAPIIETIQRLSVMYRAGRPV